MPRTVKIALEVDAKLYGKLVPVAKENGQSQALCLGTRAGALPPQRSPFAAHGQA